MWESNLANVENAHLTAVLESKFTEPLTSDCSQVAPKQQTTDNLKDTHNLVIAIGTVESSGCENHILQGNITLLPNHMVPDTRRADKIAECILFSNKLETMLGEMEELDENGSMIKDSELMESIGSNNTSAVAANSKGQTSEPDETNTLGGFDKTVSTEPLVNSPALSRLQGFCFKFKEEFGFFVIPSFLILSVSFLFLAYGCSAPLVYLVPYALSIGVKHRHAAFLMSIFGVSGIVGNITFGWIMDRR